MMATITLVVRLNKMKIVAILLLVLALGLVATGCSKASAPQKNVPATTQTASDTANNADITVDTATTNPDIGTLDNASVSDELPQ
jgi:PBP1b-binding outer membrane lipoprotein LpoB